MDAVARGQINFNDLEATPQDVWDYIGPRQVTTSVSELWQVQGTLAKDLFELPGGPLQAAVGVSYRDESIDAPSANPGTLGNQYDRYYSINSVGTAGRSDEPTYELQSLMRNSYAAFCLEKNK